jgi:hypothetical protein
MTDLVSIGWTRAADFLPDTPRCVLATDTESHFVAIWHEGVWSNAATDEEIDSVVTHWQELPELPEDDG